MFYSQRDTTIVPRNIYTQIFLLALLVNLMGCSNKDSANTGDSKRKVTENAQVVIDSIEEVQYTSLPKMRQYIKKLEKLNDDNAQIYADYYTLRAKYLSNNEYASLQEYTSIYDRLKRRKLYKLMIEIDKSASFFYSKIGRDKEVLSYAERSLEYVYKCDLLVERTLIVYAVNFFFQTMSVQERELELEKELIKLENKEWQVHKLDLWYLLASTKEYLGKYEEAKKITEMCIEKSKEMRNNYSLARGYLVLGRIEEKSGNNHNKSLQYFLTSIEVEKMYGVKNSKLNYLYAGKQYRKLKNYRKSYEFFKKLENYERIDSSRFARDLAYMGESFFYMNPENNYEGAIRYLDKAMEYVTIKDFTFPLVIEKKIAILKTSGFEKEVKNLQNLLKTYQSSKEKRNNKIPFDVKPVLKLHLKNHKLEQLENDNKLKEAQLENKNLLEDFFIGSIIILLILVVLILITTKSLLKNKVLNEELSQTLSQIEIVNSELETKNTENSRLLEVNERTLFSKLLKISMYKDTVDNVSKYVSQLIQNKENVKVSDLFCVEKKLKTLISEEDIWVDFQIQFEKTRPDFFTKLKEIAPKLTINELKHCAYITTKLNVKQVASLISVSPRSVETARYRIKKKLGLGRDESIFDFLEKI
ncbi:hypothetical protein P8625_15710 [Tenacibaculum tangerinum]|uniref:HTH luxR-type domain-containing protein n=1 Tax=Tenacibaculum tangerinum TaxID=3038772 RepID=A0ABY8L212_9FLAO|nr:hypothetical protein [Tenacibaculum tangerinum]WGH75491.1 hypothetical protein P8625_15710 [Tenacibaculum tangerinum]